MDPRTLSSTAAGVWRKAPGLLPDSNSVLDKFQSANTSDSYALGSFQQINEHQVPSHSSVDKASLIEPHPQHRAVDIEAILGPSRFSILEPFQG